VNAARGAPARKAPRTATALLWAAGAVTAFLVVASLVPCLRFLPILLSAGDPGFTWEYDARSRAMAVTSVAADGPAGAAGLRPGDRVLRLNGRPPAPALDLWGPPERPVPRPGDRLELQVTRAGKSRTLAWALAERPWPEVRLASGGWRMGMDQSFHGFFLLAAVATWGLGAWVLRQKPHLTAARALAGLSWALCLAQLGAVLGHAPRETIPGWLFHLTFANDGWARLSIAAGIYFLLLFPERKPLLDRHPRAVPLLVFLPAGLLLVAHGALGHSLWRFEDVSGEPGRARAIALLETVDWWGYSVPAGLSLLGLLAYSYATAHGGRARRQVGALGIAVAPLTLYALAATFYLLRMGSVPLWLSLLSPFICLAWPVALAWAILTQGAFDVSRAVRRGVSYALSTVAVAAVGFLIAALVGQKAIARLGPGSTGWIVAGVALLAQPIWAGVRRWVDRRFGRDRLAVLRRLETLSGEIATILEPGPLADALVERVPGVLGATRAVLFVRQAGAGSFDVVRAAGQEWRPAEPPISSALAVLADALAAGHFPPEPLPLYLPREEGLQAGLAPGEAEAAEAARLVLWMPLGARGESELVLALGWKRREDVYTPEEIALLRVIGTQAVSAWETIRLIREREARVRVEQEIAVGRAIQARLLPPTPLHFAGYRIDARCESAAQVGGDFYNIFAVGEEPAQGETPTPTCWGIVLGDVSGKGVPAALYMAVASSLLEGQAQGAAAGTGPGDLLARANDRLHPKLRPLRMFVTALCVVLEPESGRLLVASAGQTPPILWRAGAEPEFLRLSGLPLGARARADYEQRCLSLAPGDLLILVSDGLVDQSDPDGYAELRRRLGSDVRSHPDALLDALYSVAETAEPDDRTALLLSRAVWETRSDSSSGEQ
jgi:serine phosphatase RsbU (regulator of sigma subunit)